MLTTLGFVIALSYLIGGIPFGYIAARVRGIDITKYGSGATGATNVLRTLGTLPAVTVAILDVSKGAASVLLARQMMGSGDHLAQVLSGLSAMVGHSFSPYLRFRGGKSVSVGAGVGIALMPMIILYALLIFITTVYLSRYVSLGSLVGAASALAIAIASRAPLPHLSFLAAGVLLVLFQHRSNIKRLLTGTENKIGQKVKIN